MKTTVWLVVGNGMNWGKGKTLLAAFANCMDNDSRTYPTTVLHLRQIIVDHDAPLFAGVTPAEVFARVAVDGMGSAKWPAGAEVRKLDIGKDHSVEPTTVAMLKKWRAFTEEWTELMCTEYMDLAFGGDASTSTEV